jgi:uncharacterized protein DUF6946
MSNLFYAQEIVKPEDVIPFLAKQERHWKKNYSAYELAYSWVLANGIPGPIREVLKTCDDYTSVDLVEAFFERDVDLRTAGRRSQTDLLAFISAGNSYSVLAVEGKAEESFGPLVSEWRDGSPGKENRLSKLCGVLGLHPNKISHLRYQLLHRSVSAIYEAQRYRCRRAVMLVHSFSEAKTSFADFVTFTEAINLPVHEPGQMSDEKNCDGIQLRLAWCADKFAV